MPAPIADFCAYHVICKQIQTRILRSKFTLSHQLPVLAKKCYNMSYLGIRITYSYPSISLLSYNKSNPHHPLSELFLPPKQAQSAFTEHTHNKTLHPGNTRHSSKSTLTTHTRQRMLPTITAHNTDTHSIVYAHSKTLQPSFYAWSSFPINIPTSTLCAAWSLKELVICTFQIIYISLPCTLCAVWRPLVKLQVVFKSRVWLAAHIKTHDTKFPFTLVTIQSSTVFYSF